MKYVFKSAILATILLAASCTREPGIEEQTGGNDSGPIIVNASPMAVSGEIILKLRTDASAVSERAQAAGTTAGTRSGIYELDRILNSVNTVRFERLFPACGRFEERTRKEGMHLWYYAQYDPSVPTRELARMLSQCRDIEVIEYSLPTTTAGYTAVATPSGEQTRAASISRNTPFPFNEDSRSQTLQWHYNNTGSIFSLSTALGADANIYAAWQLETGNPDVIVAVVDQGVKYDHEDLAANMWINKAELNGTEGVDDDANGYVDDIYGYNFVNNTGKLTFSDKLNHGTHVAGTVAAVNNNGIGVCGVAGGSGKGDGVRIMSCEILGVSQSNSGAGLGGSIRAIKYGADNGAVISQNSWGYTAGTLSQTDWTKGSYSALSRAIAYFTKYAGMDENSRQEGPMAGGMVIFAAGNDAMNEICYPAADPNVVSVGATGFRGNPSSFTNYGKWVTLCAPGGDQALSVSYGGVYSTSVNEAGGSDYAALQGTSMACPHVSGACALAISYYYGAEKRKGLTPDMLRQALMSSTRPIDAFCTGNYAPYLGNMGIGSLDAYRLLLTIAKSDALPVFKLTAGATKSIDLGNYFVSTDILTYTVDNPQLVSVSLSGGNMTIKGLQAGRTTIIVSDGIATRKPMEVVVE